MSRNDNDTGSKKLSSVQTSSVNSGSNMSSAVVEAHRKTQMEQLRKKFGEYGEPYRVGEYKEFNMYFENGDPCMFWVHADTKFLHDLRRYIQVSNGCHHIMVILT